MVWAGAGDALDGAVDVLELLQWKEVEGGFPALIPPLTRTLQVLLGVLQRPSGAPERDMDEEGGAAAEDTYSRWPPMPCIAAQSCFLLLKPVTAAVVQHALFLH